MEKYEEIILNIFKDKVNKGVFTVMDVRWLLSLTMNGDVTSDEFANAVSDLIVNSSVIKGVKHEIWNWSRN